MPRKQKKYHFIYKTTCLVTNKFYIGMHSTNNLDDGYLGSGKRLWYSMKKHGKENHVCEKLGFFETREELKEKEREIVNLDLLKDFLCMNLQPGGEGGWTSEQQSINGQKGNKKMKWLRDNDDEWLKNKSLKQSISQKRSYKNGRISNAPDWTGKKHSDLTKQKIGKSNSISQLREKNSQFGTCWITNGKENKKIKKYCSIPEGWELGRKIRDFV